MGHMAQLSVEWPNLATKTPEKIGAGLIAANEWQENELEAT